MVRLVLVGVGKEGGRVKDEGMMEGRVHNTGFTAANAVRCKRIYFSCCSRRRKKRRRRMLGRGRSFLGQVCVSVAVVTGRRTVAVPSPRTLRFSRVM